MIDGNKADLRISWPGIGNEPLNAKQNGLNWQHAYYGHNDFYQDCYSCACEAAY
jgi:hypothetical protein